MVWTALLHNVALLLALAALYSVLRRRLPGHESWIPLLLGILFGVTAVAAMLDPATLRPGLLFDGRSIVLSMAGLFGGPVPAAIASLIAAAYRLHLGGTGAVMGVGTIVTSAGLGVVYQYLSRTRPTLCRPLGLLLFGLVVHLAVLAWIPALPEILRGMVARQIALPYLTLLPLGSLLFALLLKDLDDREQLLSRLAEREQSQRSLVETTPDILLVLDARSLALDFVSPRVRDHLGYSPAELMAEPGRWPELLHPDDAEAVLSSLRRSADHPGEVVEVAGRARHRDGGYRWLTSRLYTGDPGEGRVPRIFGVVRDTTEQQRREQCLRDSEERFRQLAENIQEVFFLIDIREFRILYVSPAYEAIWGRDRSEVYADPRAFLKGVHVDDRGRVEEGLRRQLEGAATRFDCRVVRPDGELRHVSVRTEPVRDARGEVIRAAGVAEDVTDLREAEMHLRRAATVFESSLEGVMITDADARILAVNRAFCEITGYGEDEVLGNTPRLLRSGRHGEEFYQAMRASLERTGQWKGEIWNRCKRGRLYPTWTTTSAIYDRDDGRVSGYVSVFSDISDLRRTEEQLEYLSHHDPLTALPNRLLLHARLEHTLQRARRRGSRVAVILLDLDRFKLINEGLGHPAGDALLRAVAERLLGPVRKEDTVARVGGDEFVIVLDEIEDLTAVQRLIETFIARLGEELSVHGHAVRPTASLGVSVFPDNGEDVTELLKNADSALYRAKAQGRDTYCFYAEEMGAEVAERLDLELALRRALNQGEELALHYQPQVELANGRPFAVEALVRWSHPERGEIPPARFIPLAEDCGLIHPLGDWILGTACRQLRRWLDQGLELHGIAINVSGKQLSRPGFVDSVRHALEDSGLEPVRLELEITETTLMTGGGAGRELLHELGALGVRLSVDDFGTGYSSLSYLKQLPVDALKIDQSFVRDAPEDRNDAGICRAVVALAESLGLGVIAEGVETEAQRAFLLEAGCRHAQGYLFARPRPAGEIPALLGAGCELRAPAQP